MTVKLILAVGNPLDAISLIGPFDDDPEQVTTFAEVHFDDVPWSVVTLLDPKKLDEQVRT